MNSHIIATSSVSASKLSEYLACPLPKSCPCSHWLPACAPTSAQPLVAAAPQGTRILSSFGCVVGLVVMLCFGFFIALPVAETVTPGMWEWQATFAKKIANEPMAMCYMEGGASAHSYEHDWTANETVALEGTKVHPFPTHGCPCFR